MKWLLPLMVLLSLITFTGCDDDSKSGCKTHTDCQDVEVCDESGSCIIPEISPSITIEYLSSGTLNGYEFDKDPATPGIQITISVDTIDIPDGNTIMLNITGTNTTSEEATLVDGKAFFKDITLSAGDISIQATGKDKYLRSIQSLKLNLTVNDATLVFTGAFENSPIELTSKDDEDPDKFYIQKDVTLLFTGVNDGIPVTLYLYNAESGVVKDSAQTTITNSMATFSKMSFPKGDWRLVASFENARKMLVQSAAALVSSEALPGQCNVNIITPEEGTVINQAYLEKENLEGKLVTVKVTSDCPSNFSVEYLVNNTVVESSSLIQEGDLFVSEKTLLFPENKENDGDSTLLVNIVNPTNSDEGGNDTAHYTIDTIAPVLSLQVPTENQELFPGDDLDNTKEGIQIYLKGSSDDAMSDLTVTVGDDMPQLFPQAFDPESETPFNFNTELNSDNPYITVSESGTQNIIVTANDQYGNAGTASVTVAQYLDATLMITQVGTHTISGNTLTLNQNDDDSETLNNLQTTITASTTGFSAGRIIKLYRGDGVQVTEAQIDASNVVEFKLNSTALGLPNGVHNIYLETKNSAGHSIQSTKLTVTISTTKPVLILRSHTSGSYIKDGTVTIELGAQNLTPTTDFVTMNFNSIDITAPVKEDGSVVFSDIALIQDNSLSYTPNVFTFSAEDIAGNQADAVVLTLNYDPDTPLFAITTPTKTELVREDDTNDSLGGIQTVVTILVSNESPGGIATLYLNGTAFGSSVVLAETGNDVETTAVFNDVSLTSGTENILKVVIVDQAGNQSEKSKTVTVDDGCYALQFSAPTINGTYLNNSSYQGMVYLAPLGSNNHIPDGITLTLGLNAQSYQVTSVTGGAVFGTADTQVPLIEGDNTLIVSYDVDASTHCELSASLNYDTGKPVINQLVFVDQNDDNHKFDSGTTTHLGAIYDRNSSTSDGQVRVSLSLEEIEAGEQATLIIDGDTGNPVTSTITCDTDNTNCIAELNFTLVEGGPYQLQFQVTDRSGNISDSYTVTTSLDLTTPQVAFDDDFPEHLNTSPGVDSNLVISGLQYDVIAHLNDVSETDSVRLYIHHSDYQGDDYLADMYYDEDGNSTLDQVKTEITINNTTLCSVDGDGYVCTFPNVTFPLSDVTGYTLELVVEDLAGNQTTVSQENYMVENALTVSFTSTAFLDRNDNTNQTNKSDFDIELYLNRSENGNLFLDVLSTSTVSGTPVEINLGPASIDKPDVTETVLIPFETQGEDGRYELKPRFVDEFNFSYEGQTGYVAYKGTVPSLVYTGKTTFNRSDLNGNSEFDMNIQINNLYLDTEDFTDQPITLELRQNTGTGTSMKSSVVPENGTLNLSVPLLEGKNYSVVLIKDGAALKDNFGNTIDNNSLGTFLVDTVDPIISSVSANSGTNNKIFGGSSTTIIISDQVDKDSNTTDLETDLVIYVNDINGDGGTVQLTNITGTPSQIISGGQVTFSDLVLSESLNKLDITVTDLAGNSTNKSFPLTIDLEAPTVSISTIKDNFVGNDDVNTSTAGFQINLGITASGADTVRVERSNSIDFSIINTIGSQNGALTSMVVTLPENTSYLRVVALDEHGNETTSNVLTLNVTLSSCVLTAVNKGITGLTASANYVNNDDVTTGEVTLSVVTTSACNGYTFEVQKAGMAIGSPVTISTTSQNFNLAVADGESFDLTVTLPDFTGETATYPIVVDTTAPTLTNRVPDAGYDTLTYVTSSNINISSDDYIADKDSDGSNGAQADFIFTSGGAVEGTVELFNGTTSLGSKTIPVGEVVLFENINLAHNSSHSMKAIITDPAGNTTENSFTAVVDVIAPDAPATFTAGTLSDTERRQASLSVPFTWAASGDDETGGTPDKYIVKYEKGLAAIDNAGFEAFTENVTDISDGTATTQNITGFIYHNDYTIAIRAYDEVGNYSDITTQEINYTLASEPLDVTGIDPSIIGALKDVGDINGDGFNDFVITQPQASVFIGKVLIYYGNSGNSLGTPVALDGIPSNMEEPNAAMFNYSGLGSCVTSADFDGDGDLDLVIGATYYSGSTSSNSGAIFVYENNLDNNDGKIDPDKYIIIEDTAETGFVFLGQSCDNIGKLDSGNSDEIIIGESGTAFIVKGRNINFERPIDPNDIHPYDIDLSTDSDTIKLTHEFGSGSNFGVSVTGLGNIDNAGSVDVAVGSPANSSVVLYHLTSGSSGTITSTDPEAVILSGGSQFGTEVKGNIDINGDGYLDLAVKLSGSFLAIYYGDNTQFNSGKTRDFRTDIAGNNWSISDYDGDGDDDLTIGDSDNIYIYLASKTGGVISYPDVTIKYTTGADYNASSFDLNHDGINDFVICDTDNKTCTIYY